MKQYINKSALVAEIKKRLKYNGTRAELDRSAFMTGRAEEDKDILAFLNTLKEVKEVEEPSKDLEKEFDKCCENYIFDDECEVYTARKFFELGFKAKGE